MTRKKIAFFLGSMGRGGAERVISILSREYAESGWNTDICLLLQNKVDYILHDETRLFDFSGKTNNRILRVPLWLYNIRNYVKKEKPDVVVAFAARINILVMIACLGLKTKIIVSERNDPKYDGRGIVTKIFTKILYPVAHHVVFQTQRVKDQFDEKVKNNSSVIPNPITVTAESSKIKYKKIVSVGRLTKQKNQKMLIEAFAGVVKKHPDYKLYIYGDGELKQELEHLASAFGISDKVFLPGNVLNVHEKIADAEMFVLSSDYEGLSNALLEAMMIGLPCISTNCAGSDEYIENKKNGMLVSVGDVQELEKAMLFMVENENERIAMGEQAKKSSTSFCADNVLNLWHGIID